LDCGVSAAFSGKRIRLKSGLRPERMQTVKARIQRAMPTASHRQKGLFPI
jgi:hypothetical protein